MIAAVEGKRRNYREALSRVTQFGTGSLAVTPGLIVVSAPGEARSFVWTRKEALVLATLLEADAPRMAQVLREAAQSSVDEYGGHRRE